MTPPRALRVALLEHPAAGALAAALTAAGCRVTVVGAPRVVPLDELLTRRGFTGPLTHVPRVAGRLLRGDHDLVHAFSPADAAAARAWRRRTRRPVVFTCVEELDRSVLADRRLRMRLLAAAVERADAVVAPDEAARAALRRWMAVGATVIAPDDAAGHLRLYAGLAR